MEIVLVVIFILGAYFFITMNDDHSIKDEEQQAYEEYFGLRINDAIYKVHYSSDVSIFINREKDIMMDSDQIIHKSKNLETIASRLELLYKCIDNLYDYASNPEEVDVLKEEMSKRLDIVVAKRCKIIIEEALIKSKNAKTKRGKISPIEKVKTQLELHQGILSPLSQAKINDALEYYMDLIEAEDLYDKYKKFEFKNNQKKAQEYKKDLEYFLSKAHQELRNINIDKEDGFSKLKIKMIAI